MSLIAEALKAAQREKARRQPPREERGPATRSFLSLRARRGTGIGKMSSPMMLASALLAGMVAVLIAVVVVTTLRGRREGAALAAVDAAPVGPSVSDTAPALFGDAPPISELDEDPVPYADGSLASTPYPIPRYAEDPLPAPREEPAGDIPTNDTGDRAVDAAPPAQSPARAGALKITMESPAELRANPYVQQALAAQRQGNLVGAKELYDRALALSPDNAELHNNLGALHRSLGDLAQAEESYRRAIALDGKLASAWSNLGVVLEARGRRREATAAFQEAIRLDPSNAATKVNLAIQYHAAGLHADAGKLLEEALRRDPSMSEAHYAFARLLEEQGRRAEAVREYNLFLTTSAGRFPDLEERVRRHIEVLSASAR